jgi:phage recombination protein Bet
VTQVVSLPNQTWTPDQMRLITEVVARGATPDELKLFLYRCQNMGLDPLKPGQIHFVKYGNSPGTIVVGIEGFRVKAHRTGKCAGIKRGVLRNAQGDCIGAWSEAYRSDWQHPARVEVSLAEYSTGKGPWAKMPESMIQKVAEAAALRMAFPDDLGGVYTKEEMDQAADALPDVKPEQPEPGNGDTTPNPSKLEGGQWAGLTVDEVYRKFGPERMASYVTWIESEKERPNLTKYPWRQTVAEKIAAFLAHKEREMAAQFEGGRS